MGNVNSEDPGVGQGATAPDEGGGSTRVRQLPQEPVGRSIWAVAGTIVVALLLLMPVVWITVELGPAINVFGDDPITWIYASALVLIVAAALCYLFRVLRQQRGDDADRGGNVEGHGAAVP